MKVKVFYHDKCFDGACSAALFTRFYRERIREHAEFEYHRPGASRRRAVQRGASSPATRMPSSTSSIRLRRASPGGSTITRARFSRRRTPRTSSRSRATRKFYDPDFRSCTKFIATVTAEQRFGFNPAPVAELIEWADIIDGALYDDPQAAVEMKAPAMKLTMVIESNQDPSSFPR